MTRIPVKYALLLSLSAIFCGLKPATQDDRQNADWPVYGGNNAGNRYSALAQINKGNVASLKPAWTYDTGENNKPGERGMDIQCQPIVIDGVMYGTTPRLKVFAIEAATGKELWKFDPFEGKRPRFHPMRGVVYWSEGKDKRILFTAGPSLFAINAETGKLVEGFGKNGEVDFHDGLGDKETYGYDLYQFNIRNTTPGVIYKNLLITGSSVSEGGDALPGHIRAFDVRTGKVAWVFRTIPLPGEYGYETWSKDSYKKLGGANCWAGMVIDEKRGMVFMGTGSPSVDFYGAARKGSNLFANCVIALNAATGKRVWHFQTVHHDLWDRDIPCPPNLISVKRDGKMVDAVAQATKDGYIFLLNRDTGKPLFPVQEVPVPKSKPLPGDDPWPTQPVPTKPAPFANQTLTETDITNRTPGAHAYVLDRYLNSNKGPKNQPPDTLGGLLYGIGGGAEWGGTAADPSGVVYVNGNNMLWWLKMRDGKLGKEGQVLSKGQVLFNTNCAACHATDTKTVSAASQAYPVLKDIGKRMNREQIGTLLETGRGRMPSFQHISKEDRAAIVDFLLRTENKPAANDIHAQTADVNTKSNADFPYIPPYVNNGNVQFRDQDNYPAIKPPWGTLNAIDMNTGEYLWKVTLGEYPELARQGIPPTGTENHGGPLVTAGGLLFIAATYDEKLRAFDIKTGKVVWEYQLPAGGFATPITYMVGGKQYIAIAAGGTRYGLKPGGNYIAFALP
ncbi:PQQ-binding-like beta-propeller repeat protein [Dyadobacter sp. CY261]|uniref:outer membrane protein assembly factor BamB family protein n=1 Tax=Dyadobacter sp. CY261 TaxID=2907203 RepID=UPI001F1B6F75|nr:PQQ-binding-like beta-propeller repeat protein [Dyadobacter sp. CY261]MCF0069866.1 PQQ-binding-like beta-propeller repeat protein [Dyadobacter sp. CY261]